MPSTAQSMETRMALVEERQTNFAGELARKRVEVDRLEVRVTAAEQVAARIDASIRTTGKWVAATVTVVIAIVTILSRIFGG